LLNSGIGLIVGGFQLAVGMLFDLIRFEGRAFRDNDGGNTVFVRGDKVVIESPDGKTLITKFINQTENTQSRIASGRWTPIENPYAPKGPSLQ
jgi:hypothetical protein